jgi:hypothetical protein
MKKIKKVKVIILGMEKLALILFYFRIKQKLGYFLKQ